MLYCLQAFFINHNYKITSFIDPRLPTSPDNTLEQALIQQQQHQLTESQDSMGLKTLPRNQHPQTVGYVIMSPCMSSFAQHVP